MPEVIALFTLAGLFSGLALGWYLRRINAWCPQCGHALTCGGCGERPNWSPPRRVRRRPLRAYRGR
jgi:hypothetical protein